MSYTNPLDNLCNHLQQNELEYFICFREPNGDITYRGDLKCGKSVLSELEGYRKRLSGDWSGFQLPTVNKKTIRKDAKDLLRNFLQPKQKWKSENFGLTHSLSDSLTKLL